MNTYVPPAIELLNETMLEQAAVVAPAKSSANLYISTCMRCVYIYMYGNAKTLMLDFSGMANRIFLWQIVLREDGTMLSFLPGSVVLAKRNCHPRYNINYHKKYLVYDA